MSSVHDSDYLKWLILRQTKNIKTVDLINQTSWLSPIPWSCCLQSVLLDTEVMFLETGGNLSSLRNAHDWLPPGESCTSLVWYWDWATNFPIILVFVLFEVLLSLKPVPWKAILKKTSSIRLESWNFNHWGKTGTARLVTLWSQQACMTAWLPARAPWRSSATWKPCNCPPPPFSLLGFQCLPLRLLPED